MLDLELIKERQTAANGSVHLDHYAHASLDDVGPLVAEVEQLRGERLELDDYRAIVCNLTRQADLAKLKTEAERYAMARALLYLRQTHDHDEWYNEEYVVAEPINLLINALGTKDVRPILEKRDGTD